MIKINILDNLYKNLNMLKKHENFSHIFVSLGKVNIKAKVKSFKNGNYLNENIEKYIQQFHQKSGQLPQWIKIDIVTQSQTILFKDLITIMENKRRNYIDFGFSLDKSYNFSFLPEEINANAFLKPDKNKKNARCFSDSNVTHYLKNYKKYRKKFRSDVYANKTVFQFWTKSYFFEAGKWIPLGEEGGRKGLRHIDNLTTEIDKMIETSTHYLKNEIQPNGQFQYGYFPHFDRKIQFYNILRHCSSTYALTEGLSYLKEDMSPVRRALQYITDHSLLFKGDIAYIYDDTKGINEIKLGQNAAFIFAVCEYVKYHPNEEKLLKVAQAVAKGILTMINHNTMETTHVLNYPDLSIKESFRIIYYDGEATLALLRLYQIDQCEEWLHTVKCLMERFINEKYWKYHDHWLAYCTNELVQIEPEEHYFELGIRNASSYLEYIYQRETTFPTFLEMLMATYHLVQKAKQEGFKEMIDDLIDEEMLIKTIHERADYQRTGYFYPEYAMYFKNPKRILGSFFIKHHGYRVRIDDIEHYLSGYIQYQKVFK